MNASLSFQVSERIHVRQLSLVSDEAVLGALGKQCVDYLRIAVGQRLGPENLADCFLAMLKPRRVPPERSFALGIFVDEFRGTAFGPRLAGVLYFLHPELRPDTWYIPLLLLEPAMRGQGVGSAVHAAFVQWARQRGARRLMVAVADGNERARRFWCDRLGYTETDSGTWGLSGVPTRKNREFTCLLATAAFADCFRLQAA